MIIVGYVGIGKTTASKMFREVVDLPSTLFTDKSLYCDVAIELSKQDLFVCVSSHEEVIRNLLKSDEQVCVVYPGEFLRATWISLIRNRYLQDKTESNHKALVRVCEHFRDDIDYLSNLPFDKIELNQGEFLSHKLIPGEPPENKESEDKEKEDENSKQE